MRGRYEPLYLTVPTADDCARDAWEREQVRAVEERERASVQNDGVRVIDLHDTEDTGGQFILVFDPEDV